jgi:hypothetical protein
LLSQAAQVHAADADPDLRPGFPIKAYHQSGMSFGGLANNTLVADIDGGGDLEIIAAGTIQPLYAWKSDGSVVPGWPISAPNYCSAGDLSHGFAGDELVCVNRGSAVIDVFTGGGTILPGWPVGTGLQPTPPSLADLDHDGIDEIFLTQPGPWLNALRADGSNAPGWPVAAAGSTPAIGDLDGDGELEIVTATIRPFIGIIIDAFHHDGARVTGFPVVLHSGYEQTFPVIGDVDGDGVPEIIVIASDDKGQTVVHIYSNEGVLKRTIPLNGMIGYVSAPALADLDGDGIPEIIVQLDGMLTIVRGTDGTNFPGWPVLTGGLMGWSSPVVGDIDGDGLPDIVILSSDGLGESSGRVLAYNRAGHLLRRFPKTLPLGYGAVPAIADLDNTGVNQIIVTGSYGYRFPNTYDKVWVYDLGAPSTGPVQWGQFMEGAKHNGYYRGGFDVPNDQSILDVKKTGTGTGTITAVGIDCGIDCSATFTTGTLVTLTATAHDPDSAFIGWEGAGCSGAADCVVDLESDTLVTAVFDFVYVDLTVARAGTGSGWVLSNPYGVECLIECRRSFVRGTSVTLTFSSNTYDGSQRFDGWSGGGCSGIGQCTVVVMSGNTTVTATITAGGLIKAGAMGVGQGTITSSPGGIDCGGDCEEFYPAGTVLTLTAHPADGSNVHAWFGPCVASNDVCTMTVSGSTTVGVEFGKIINIESILGLTLSRKDGKFGLFWWFELPPLLQPLSVRIDLSRDGGATWTPIAKKTRNDGGLLWKVKGPPTNNAKFRVCGLDNYIKCGEGDVFRIQ